MHTINRYIDRDDGKYPYQESKTILQELGGGNKGTNLKEGKNQIRAAYKRGDNPRENS